MALTPAASSERAQSQITPDQHRALKSSRLIRLCDMYQLNTSALLHVPRVRRMRVERCGHQMSGQGEVTGVVGTRAYRDITRSPHGTLIRHRRCADWSVLIKTNSINKSTQTGNISMITGLYDSTTEQHTLALDTGISISTWLSGGSLLSWPELKDKWREHSQSAVSMTEPYRKHLHRCMNEGLVSPSILLLILVLVNHEWSRAGSFNT